MNKRFNSRDELMRTINEVSLAVNDIALYLNTHPDDENALAYFREKVMERNEALKEYAVNYGPLTIDTAKDDCSRQWDWVMQPWPWEGGC